MRILALVFLLTFSGVAHAQQSPEAMLAGLIGEWEGALGYRDYQSNRLFELPVHTTIDLASDGRTLIRTSRYDEGAAPHVFIVSASALGADGAYETAGFRAGRQMSVNRETIAVSRNEGPQHWTLVFSERGMDDERAADIRVTLTRDGDTTLAVKEVDYVDDPAVQFEFRNQTRLMRVR